MRSNFLSLSALFCVVGCSGSTPDETPPPVALVSLATAAQGSIAQQTTLYGAAEASAGTQVALAAPADAQVVRIVAPIGTKVGPGDVVALLAPAPNTRLDIAKASADARAADAALARARRLRADGLVSDAEVETARAAAAGADATRASLSGRAGALTLRAPAGGYIATVDASPGDLVQAGTKIASITRVGDLRARFGVDPTTARLLRPGLPIRISVGRGRAPFSVPIASVDPVVDPQTRLAGVFADLPAQAGIGAGETLTGNVVTDGADSRSITVPYAALLDDAGQPYVYVVTNGVAHRRDVTTGVAEGDRIGIVKGVAPGDRVVTKGGTAVEDGMKVRTK